MKKNSAFFILFSLFLAGCGPSPIEKENIYMTDPNDTIQHSEVIEVVGDTSSVDVYHSETFTTEGISGWGYRIMLNGDLYINQPHIPAVQGNKGFSNPVFAKKTADFAILKIQQGFSPPTITVEELDSLGVLK